MKTVAYSQRNKLGAVDRSEMTVFAQLERAQELNPTVTKDTLEEAIRLASTEDKRYIVYGFVFDYTK